MSVAVRISWTVLVQLDAEHYRIMQFVVVHLPKIAV